MVSYQRGDSVTVVTYNTMSQRNAFTDMDMRIRVKATEVVKAGPKQITISGGLQDSNIPRDKIGQAVPGVLYDTFNILVPKGENVETYISLASDNIRRSLELTKQSLLESLERVNRHLDTEGNWLNE